MSLENIDRETVKGAALNELQGINVAVLAGGAAYAKLDLAAIRTEDTIVSAVIHQATGLPVDDTANVSILALYAVGTLTGTSVVADNTVTVNSNVYTFKVAPVSLGDVALGADDDEAMLNLAAAINSVESAYVNGLGENADVVAVAVTNAVTVIATTEGTAGNAIDTVSGQGTIVASGATLTGGTDTGGVSTPTDTAGKSVVLTWFNKQ